MRNPAIKPGVVPTIVSRVLVLEWKPRPLVRANCPEGIGGNNSKRTSVRRRIQMF